jgi:hypothetical protein
MANRAIEFHDTRIERIEHVNDTIVLWQSAYMHESDGRPGWESGTGWSLPARLVIENGTIEHPLPSQSLWILDGSITVADRLFDNMVPLPFDERGEIRLSLYSEEGELVVHGERVYVEPAGEAIYVEEFHRGP